MKKNARCRSWALSQSPVVISVSQHDRADSNVGVSYLTCDTE